MYRQYREAAGAATAARTEVEMINMIGATRTACRQEEETKKFSENQESGTQLVVSDCQRIREGADGDKDSEAIYVLIFILELCLF